MNLNEMVIGIDLGGTIAHRVDGVMVPMPECMEVIARLRKQVKAIYIVSRVTDEQSLRAYWFFNRNNFFEETGLTPNKVHFCYERRDKAPICERLGVTHFIDDRPEVVSHMGDSVVKLLMRPLQIDMDEYAPWIRNLTVVNSWNEIESFFRA